MEPGDFTELASDYARYRSSYNQNVVKKILESVRRRPSNIKAADIGAGTGIFKVLIRRRYNRPSCC